MLPLIADLIAIYGTFALFQRAAGAHPGTSGLALFWLWTAFLVGTVMLWGVVAMVMLSAVPLGVE